MSVLEVYFTAVIVAMYRQMTTKSPENLQAVISHVPIIPMTNQQSIPMSSQQSIPMIYQESIPMTNQPNVQDMHVHQGSLMATKMSAFNS